MDEGLKQELIRHGIVFKGDIQRTKFINDKEYDIPEPLQEFFGALNKTSFNRRIDMTTLIE
jgi:hypothetical protein